MSDGKAFSKSKSLEIRAELEQVLKKLKPTRIKIVLHKVVANIILNNGELVNLMGDIIPLMKIDDFELRKLCCYYLQTYASINPTGASEALPYLDRWSKEVSPDLCILALKTSSAISNPDFCALSLKIIKLSLKNKNINVRKTAALSASRLYEIDPTRVEKSGLISDLNDLLYDESSVVVSAALASLGYIVENSNGLALTIDKEHSLNLVKHLSKTNEWSQIYILNSLMSYVPQTSQEALDIIESTIPSLLHENSSVILNAIKVIVYCSNYVSNPEIVLPALPKKLGSSLVSLLSKPAEIQFIVLRNVILLLLGNRDLISLDVKLFFCNYDDPIYIKDTKLEIIYLLANEENVHTVLRELEEYATEVDIAMARKAIRAFGNLAIKLQNAATECVEVLCDLCSNEIPYVIQESVTVLKNILRKYPGEFNFAINDMMKYHSLITEPEAKTSLIWILGQYGENTENSASIIDELSSTFKEDSIEVQYATLTAVTKIYLKLPQQSEKLVLKILKWATEEVDNPDIRDRGYIYWRLISSTDSGSDEFQKHAKQVVLNSTPKIATTNENLDPKIVEELELSIGSLASIYLKPIQQVFRLAKPQKLPLSPALQVKKKKSSVVIEEVSKTVTPKVPPKAPVRRTLAERDSVSQLRRPSSSASSETSGKYDDKPKESFVKRLSRRTSIKALR